MNLFLWIIIAIIVILILALVGTYLYRRHRRLTMVRAIVFYPNKRVGVYWVKPSGAEKNLLTIGALSFVINDRDFFLSKGTPTYTFNSESAEPLDPFNANRNAEMTAQDFNIAVSAKVAEEIFLANRKQDVMQILMILGVVTLAGLFIVGYLVTTKANDLMLLLQEIREVLRNIGGM